MADRLQNAMKDRCGAIALPGLEIGECGGLETVNSCGSESNKK